MFTNDMVFFGRMYTIKKSYTHVILDDGNIFTHFTPPEAIFLPGDKYILGYIHPRGKNIH